LPPADAYVFDIDGTLLISRDLVHWNAFRRAMIEAYGVDATIEGIQCHGMTDLLILRAALARAGIQDGDFEAKLPRALQVVRREVELNHQQLRPEICLGVQGLVHTLRASGKLLGVASGNLESVGWHKIAAAGLRQFFSFGCFSDHCETRAGIFRAAIEQVQHKLGPKARVSFVGDTPADISAAKEVGASVVAVASGIFPFEELSSCSPDACVAHCGQLVCS
jgi:phosphoglycolate phosphatase